MVSIIFVALTDRDIARALKQVTAKDIILTDIYCSPQVGQVEGASFQDSSDGTLVTLVANWFKEQCRANRVSYGYVNNFYQSSIRPIAGYLSAIDEIIASRGKNNIVFHLPSSLLWKARTSTYYLAEYESAGVRLYDRHATLLPYIEEYLQSKNISYQTGKRRWPLQVGILNPIRLWGVFLSRLLIDIKRSIKNPAGSPSQINKVFDKIFIIRTVGQAISIARYLSVTRETILVIIGTSNTDVGSYDLLRARTAEQENITIVEGLHPDILKTLSIYAKTFWQMLLNKNEKFSYKGIKFNLSQALLEVTVMNAGLDIYESQIREKITSVTASFLFSLEQKSPHAFVDAGFAKECKMPSAQIQCCQQTFFNLPNPVCADYFLCETPKIQKEFQACWPGWEDKVRYVGSIKGIKDENSAGVRENGNQCLRVCLFTGFEKDVNVLVLKAFADFSKEYQIEVSVKLHPRDRENYSDVFPEAMFIHSYQEEFSEFCTKFDLAITYPSSVISDLLFTDLPFLVYLPESNIYQAMEIEFLPVGMIPVKTMSELFVKLQSIEELKITHTQIINAFRTDQGIITNINYIESNFDDLTVLYSGKKRH